MEQLTLVCEKLFRNLFTFAWVTHKTIFALSFSDFIKQLLLNCAKICLSQGFGPAHVCGWGKN